MIDHLDLETEQHLDAVHLLSTYRPVVLFVYDATDPFGALAFLKFNKAWAMVRPNEKPFYVVDTGKSKVLYRRVHHRHGALDHTIQVLVIHCGRCVYMRCEEDIVAAYIREAVEACTAAAGVAATAQEVLTPTRIPVEYTY